MKKRQHSRETRNFPKNIRFGGNSYAALWICLLVSGLLIFASCSNQDPVKPKKPKTENPENPEEPGNPEEPEEPETPGTIAVASVKLNYTNLTLATKTSENLKATILPENATQKTVAWTSSNKAIVEVDATGKIKAKAPGTAIIKAVAGGKTAECKLSVPNHDIYVTGDQKFERGLGAKSTARLWKNGELVNLNQPASKDATASGFFISGNNLYVAGTESAQPSPDVYDYPTYAILWTNGNPARLELTKRANAFHVIRASNNDVYVVGRDNGAACYWKNGKRTALYTKTIGTAWGVAQAADGNVYMGGSIYEGGKDRAAIWKNGSMTLLGTTGKTSRIGKIITVGNDVYAMGYADPSSAIWKNQNLISVAYIGANGGIQDTFVSGTDIYVLGWESFTSGEHIVWKNGAKMDLKFPRGALSRIQVVDGVVYVAGASTDKIVIFANGREMDIQPQSGATQTGISSLTVVKK